VHGCEQSITRVLHCTLTDTEDTARFVVNCHNSSGACVLVCLGCPSSCGLVPMAVFLCFAVVSCFGGACGGGLVLCSCGLLFSRSLGPSSGALCCNTYCSLNTALIAYRGNGERSANMREGRDRRISWQLGGLCAVRQGTSKVRFISIFDTADAKIANDLVAAPSSKWFEMGQDK
jgi:hypothetical protein